MKTFKQLVESIPTRTVGRKYLMELLHDETLGDVVADEPVAAEVTDAPAEEQIKAAFDMAAVAVVKDESIDPATTAKKVEMLMTAKEEALAGTEPEVSLDEDEHGEDEDEEKKKVEEELHDKEEKKKVAEESRKLSVNAQLSQVRETLRKQGGQLTTITEERDALKAKDHARELLATNRRDVDDVRLVSITALSNDTLRQQLIESWPVSQSPAVVAPRPKSSVPLMEHDRDTQFESDPEEFWRSIRG